VRILLFVMTFSAALLSLQGLAIAAPTGSVGGGSGGSDVDCVQQLKDGSNLCPRGSGGHAFPPFEGSGGGEELVVTDADGTFLWRAGGGGGRGNEDHYGGGGRCTYLTDGNTDECRRGGKDK
jgi:hypothetical protein